MSYFVGSYVSDIVELAVASAVSGQFCAVIGAPGFGKSDIFEAVAAQMDGDYCLVEISPSTPPSKITGVEDPAAILDKKLRLPTGAIPTIIAGTPYDPAYNITILDEIGRGNPALFDACLHLARLAKNTEKVVWATANFLPTDPRTDALIDRLGLCLWLNGEKADVDGIVQAHMQSLGGLAAPGNIPTWDAVHDCRLANPGSFATKAVSDFIRDVSEAAVAEGLQPNPRRVASWTRVAYRLGVLHTGQADFTSLPAQATKAIRFAWPTTSADDAAHWRQIAASIVDTVGSAIETVLAEVKNRMNAVAAITDAADRMNKWVELGGYIADQQTQLRRLGDGDERIAEAYSTIQTWYAQVVKGKEVS